MSGFSVDDVKNLIDESSQLFSNSEIENYPVDGAHALHRKVHVNVQNQPESFSFLEWFEASIAVPILRADSLNDTDRIFFLSGRAGQGKSTILRNLFIHLNNSSQDDDEQIRPNFSDNLSEFLDAYGDKVHYYQAREFPKKKGLEISKYRRLILIDGLDEVSERRLESISETILANKSSMFLFSSRSRYSPTDVFDECVIRQKELQEIMNEKGNRLKLLKNTAYIQPMSRKEKLAMARMVKEFDDEDDLRLRTLAENDSPLLARPADFLLHRSHRPKTNAEYYLLHLAWLLKREHQKGVYDRSNKIKSIDLSELFRSASIQSDRGRIRIKIDDADTLDALNTLNLIEEVSIGSNAEIFLDPTVPATRGLMLAVAGGYNKTSQIDIRQMEKIDVSRCVAALTHDQDPCSRILKDCTDLLSSDSEDHTFLDLSKTFFVGYTDDVQCGEQVLKWLLERSYHHEDKIGKLRFMKWLVDVFHPIHELSAGYSDGELHPFIRKQLRDYLDTNLVSRIRVVDWDDLQDRETSTSQLNESVAQLAYRISQLCPIHPPEEDTAKPPASFTDDVKCIDPLFVQLIRQLNLDDLPRVAVKQNQRSRERFFSTIRLVLETAKWNQSQSKSRQIYFVLPDHIYLNKFAIHLLDYAQFPSDEHPSMFIKSGNDGLLLKYWEMLGNGSKYSSQIFDYVVDLGVSPHLKYVNLANDDEYNQRLVFDNPARSYNLLDRMVQKSPSPTQRSVADAMRLISQLPYQNPPSDPENHFSVVGRLNHKLNDVFTGKFEYYFLDNEPRAKQRGLLFEWLDKLQGDDKTHQFATLSHFLRHYQLKLFSENNSDTFHDVLCKLCAKGMFLPALILGLRLPEVDAVSIIFEVETAEDGFGETKNRLVGNYLHRRLLHSAMRLDNPNAPHFFRSVVENRFKKFLVHRINKFLEDLIDRLNSVQNRRQKIDVYLEFKPPSHRQFDPQSIELSDDPQFAVRPQTLELIDLRNGPSNGLVLNVVPEDWFEINFRGRLPLIPFHAEQIIRYTSIIPESIVHGRGERDDSGQLIDDPKALEFCLNLRDGTLFEIIFDPDFTENRRNIKTSSKAWRQEHFEQYLSASTEEVYFTARISKPSQIRHLYVTPSNSKTNWPPNFAIDPVELGVYVFSDDTEPVYGGFDATRNWFKLWFQNEECDAKFSGNMSAPIIRRVSIGGSNQNYTANLDELTLAPIPGGGDHLTLLDFSTSEEGVSWFKDKLALNLQKILFLSEWSSLLIEMREKSPQKSSYCALLEEFAKDNDGLRHWLIWDDGPEAEENVLKLEDGLVWEIVNYFEPEKEELFKSVEIYLNEHRLVPSPNQPISGFYIRREDVTSITDFRNFKQHLRYDAHIHDVQPENHIGVKFELHDQVHQDHTEKGRGQLGYHAYWKLNDDWEAIFLDNHGGDLFFSHYNFLKDFSSKILIHGIESIEIDSIDKDEQPDFEIYSQSVIEWLTKSGGDLHLDLVTVGDSLRFGSDVALRGWHSLPFFKTRNDRLGHEKAESYMKHLAKDEFLLSGANLKLRKLKQKDGEEDYLPEKDSASISRVIESLSEALEYEIKELDYKVKSDTAIYQLPDLSINSWIHHTKSSYHRYTQGMISLVDDESSLAKVFRPITQEEKENITENEQNELYTLDLRGNPAGLRHLLSVQPDAESSSEIPIHQISFGSTKLSSLKHGHLRSWDHTDIDVKDGLKSPHDLNIDELEPRWGTWAIHFGSNNPVYGKKFKLKPPTEDDWDDCIVITGFADLEVRRYGSNNPREVCTVFVLCDDSKFSPNERTIGHTSWRGLLEESKDMKNLLNVARTFESGRRVCRVFAVLLDTGQFDPGLGELIEAHIEKIKHNITELRSETKAVTGGRANLISLIREMKRVFGGDEWSNSHQEKFEHYRSQIEALLLEIEEIELDYLSHNQPGTIRDFSLIRAILQGIDFTRTELRRESQEWVEEIIRKIKQDEFNVDDFIGETSVLYQDFKFVRQFSSPEEISALHQAFKEHFSELSRKNERTFKRLYGEVDKMKIRIIGMPQATFPFSMNGYWDEAIGEFAYDRHEAKVGSILRLDLKTYWAAGSIKPILSNISYAVEEFDESGLLRIEHLVSGAEPNWPEYGLPETTWLPIGTTAEEVQLTSPLTGIPMYIKANRKYATHPSLEVEIPIFDTNSLPTDLSSVEARFCTIDVRRDRRKGLFRYHVTHVGGAVK